MDHEYSNKPTTQDVIDAITDQIAILDLHGTIIKVNKSWEKFTTPRSPDLTSTGVGTNYFRVLEENAGKFSILQKIKAISEHKLAFYEKSYPCHTSGARLWFNMVVTPIFDGNGQVNEIMIRHIETTSLAEYENRLIDILESMTDGFIAIEKDWTISYVNEEACRTLKTSRERLLSHTIWKAFPSITNSNIADGCFKAMNEQVTVKLEEYIEADKAWYQVHLYPRCGGGISGYFQSITQRKEMEKQLVDVAYYDDLTNLPNRNYLNKKIDELIEYSKHKKYGFAVLFIDLDSFKNINELYGHTTGDLFLKQVSKRLQGLISAPHFLGRFSGDGFVILFSGDTNSCDFHHLTEKLLIDIAQPYDVNGVPGFSTTASVGLSIFPKDGVNLDGLMSTADAAMFEAKRLGGNRLVPYDKQMKETLVVRTKLLEEFKAALETENIFFVYQPQIDTRSNQIKGLEVLTRWQKNNHSFVPPDTFINLAEETGYIKQLTEKLIDNVFPQLLEWQKAGIYRGMVSINLSTPLLHQDQFVDYLIRKVDEYQFPSGMLEMELTESIQLFTSDKIKHNLSLLRKAGIKIAIDDFGTGYSNFAYMSRFPLDKVKIDTAFIKQIGKSKRDEQILQSLIHLVNTLGLDCVAEGVETKDQLSFLEKYNCCLVQGYYYYRPIKAADLTPVLESQESV